MAASLGTQPQYKILSEEILAIVYCVAFTAHLLCLLFCSTIASLLLIANTLRKPITRIQPLYKVKLPELRKEVMKSDAVHMGIGCVALFLVSQL